MVITDHCMPGMSGPELVKKLREQSATLPIMVLSGLPEAELQYEGMDVYFPAEADPAPGTHRASRARCSSRPTARPPDPRRFTLQALLHWYFTQHNSIHIADWRISSSFATIDL